LAGDTVYTLKGREAQLDKYAGKKVAITGLITEKNIVVTSVIASK
jgi:hypothetical protein